MLSYTKVSDSRQTLVLQGHYCVKSAMFFHTKLPDCGQTPVLRGHYCVKSAMFFHTKLPDAFLHVEETKTKINLIKKDPPRLSGGP